MAKPIVFCRNDTGALVLSPSLSHILLFSGIALCAPLSINAAFLLQDRASQMDKNYKWLNFE